MIATSAHRANGTPSTATPFLRELVASLRTVQLPGNPATYANRAYLRDLGLRWDPDNHRWHGTTTAERTKELRARVNRTILEDPLAKVLAPRALHARLRDADEGPSFGEIVARSRPSGVIDVARP